MTSLVAPPHEDLGRVPGSSAEAAEHIATFTRDLVREALTVRALARTLKGAKKFIEQAAREYAERFLFELIQNAYDAQPPGSFGKVLVRFDATDGPFGSVYVANSGTPFTSENFRAICEIAQSSKRPGEGIGNKGVGFKSVLQVAAWPKIYSTSAGGTAFDGYCFRFAEPDDVARLTANASDAAVLADRLSPYGLPIHIEPDQVPAWLRALPADGYVSVVRLPLRTAEAADIARSQIRDALSTTAPILLFLDRLQLLRVETIESDGSLVASDLRRDEQRLDLHVDGIQSSEVVLGEGQRYLALSRSIDHATFLGAIEASIAATLVDESWREWEGDAVVSVAIRLERPDDADTRLYCYLPMDASATGPIAGHVNAPFAVSLARDGLVRNAPLNEFLLDAAADIVVAAALAVREHPAGRAAVTDLVAWDVPDANRLVRAYERAEQDLASVAVVPVLGDAAWASLADAYTWRRECRVLTAEAIAATGLARIVDPVLGPRRLDRLEALSLAASQRRLAPPLERLGEWAEGVAVALASRARERRGTFDGEAWIGLYDDLAEIYGRQDTASLRGRRLLIDDDLVLHPTWGGPSTAERTMIFFPMREIPDGDDPSRDVSIPKTLGRHLAYVHSGVPWKTQNVETRRLENRPGREFLDRTGLVRLPRTQSLLERIATVLARRRDKQLHADALRLVFNLTSARTYAQTPALSALNLRVPTNAGDWRPAAEAVFSAAWPGTLGAEVERLLAEAAGASSDLDDLAARLLAPPAAFGFRVEPLAAWVGFLRRIGVVDGLRPIDVTPSLGDQQGHTWPSFTGRVAVPPADHARWDRRVEEWRPRPSYPYTLYRITGRVMRLPASGDYALLPPPARETYGRLIVAGLASWGKEVLSVRVARPRRPEQADPIDFPSPVAAFLQDEAWLPVTRPGAPGVEDFARPAGAWHYRDTDGEAQPTFMPLVVTAVRRQIDAGELVADRLRSFGLNVWNERRDAIKRLRALTEAYERLDVAETLVANFRKAYERTWTLIARGSGAEPVGVLRAEDHLVVTRRGRLAVAPIASSAGTYVLVDEDRLVAAVLDTIDVPVLPIDPRDGAAAITRVRADAGVDFRAVGASDVRVLVDGEAVPNDDGSPLVIPGREWLVDLLALTLELRASAFNRQTDQRTRAALDDARAIRLHAGVSVGIELLGEPVVLPPHLRRVFGVDAPGRPAIAYLGDVTALDWDTLTALAPRIGELIGTVETGNALETVIVSLARRLGGASLTPPSDEDYSAVFEESVDRISQIRRSSRDQVSTTVYLLRPAVVVLLGEDLLAGLDRGDPSVDPVSIAARLEPVEDRLPTGRTVSGLVAAASAAPSLAALRDELGIGFEPFNAALSSLAAAGYEPIRNEQGHLVAMATYLARHRDALVERLRGASAATFDAGLVPAGYVESTAAVNRAILRRQAAVSEWTEPLAPDPEWLDRWDLPPDSVIETRVEAWLGSLVGSVGLPSGEPLQPLEVIRAANLRAVASFVERASLLIPLWALKRGGVEPPPWLSAAAVEEVSGWLSQAGLLDFRTLDDPAIIAWLGRLGHWPADLPTSLDPATLGLSDADIAAQRQAEDRARWARLQARRSIELDGHPVTLEPDRVGELVERFRSGLTEAFLRTSDRPITLEALEERRRRRSRGGDRDPRKGRPPVRMTSDQTELVGFMGELAAFDWLTRRYGSGCIWRSRYRRFVITDGNQGNDDLGFDFEVLRPRRGPLMFEVKATTTDDLAFEMSETEIAVAQENAGHDRYRVLFVRNVNDSERRWLAVLPNPLSASGRGRYRIVGRGIRYEFELTDG